MQSRPKHIKQLINTTLIELHSLEKHSHIHLDDPQQGTHRLKLEGEGEGGREGESQKATSFLSSEYARERRRLSNYQTNRYVELLIVNDPV